MSRVSTSNYKSAFNKKKEAKFKPGNLADKQKNEHTGKHSKLNTNEDKSTTDGKDSRVASKSETSNRKREFTDKNENKFKTGPFSKRQKREDAARTSEKSKENENDIALRDEVQLLFHTVHEFRMFGTRES